MPEEVEIRYYQPLNGSPLVPLATRAWADIMEAGLGGPYTLLSWDNHGLGAFHGEELVGLLVWADVEWRREYQVTLGYVRPDWRQRGVYRRLWAHLVLRAQEAGRERIEGTTYLENHAMRAAMEGLGRRAVSINYTYDVPARGKE